MTVYNRYAIFLFKDSNLKMTDDQSNRRSFLGVVFVTLVQPWTINVAGAAK